MHRVAICLLLLAAARLACSAVLDRGGGDPDPDPKACTNVACPPIDACNGGCDEGACVYFYDEPGCAPVPG